MASLGEKIKSLRTEKDMSVQEVATQIGVSRVHLWDIEKGRSSNPSLDLLRRLSDFFSVSVAWLVGEEPSTAVDENQAAHLYRSFQELTPQNRDLVQNLIKELRSRSRDS